MCEWEEQKQNICASPDAWPKEQGNWRTLCNLIMLSSLEKNENVVTGDRWGEPSTEDTLTSPAACS